MKSKGAKARREKRVVSAAKRLKEHTTGFERTTLKLPDGVGFFTPKEPGTYRLEIIPFKVGKGNKYFEEGAYAFERTFWNHRGIGAEGNSYVCPAKTAGKKCPVCEHRAKLAQDPNADEELVKSLAPKERQLFNVYDHKHPDKGVQVWEVSHYLFGKHLDNKIKNADPEDRERYEQFANEEDGLTLRITASQESMGSNTFLEFGDIEFKERKEALDPELFDQAVCLDDCLKILEYPELKKILLQIDDDSEDSDDDDDDAPKKKGKGKKTVAEDDDEDDDEDDADGDDDDDGDDADGDDDDSDDGDDDGDADELAVGSMVTGKYKKQTRTGQIKKITKGNKGQRLAHVKVRGMDQLWVADLSELSPVEPEDDDDDDDDDDDLPPPAKKKGKVQPPADDDDDDLDLGDDDDDDDTPPPPKKKGGNKPADDDLPFDLDDDDDEPDPTPKDKGKGKRKVK